MSDKRLNTLNEYEQLKRRNRRRLVGASAMVIVAGLLLAKALNHSDEATSTPVLAESEASATMPVIAVNGKAASEATAPKPALEEASADDVKTKSIELDNPLLNPVPTAEEPPKPAALEQVEKGDAEANGDNASEVNISSAYQEMPSENAVPVEPAAQTEPVEQAPAPVVVIDNTNLAAVARQKAEAARKAAEKAAAQKAEAARLAEEARQQAVQQAAQQKADQAAALQKQAEQQAAAAKQEAAAAKQRAADAKRAQRQAKTDAERQAAAAQRAAAQKAAAQAEAVRTQAAAQAAAQKQARLAAQKQAQLVAKQQAQAKSAQDIAKKKATDDVRTAEQARAQKQAQARQLAQKQAQADAKKRAATEATRQKAAQQQASQKNARDILNNKAAKASSKDPKAILEGQHSGSKVLIQAGAYSSAAQAKQVQQRLANVGISAYVSETDTSKGKVYRVRTSSFPNRAAANQALGKIRGQGLDGIVVGQ